MKSKVIFSIFCIVGTLSIATAATAGEVLWTLLTDTSLVGKGPGLDGIIGAPGTPAAADDSADATNTWGTSYITAYEWTNPGPTCPAVPGSYDDVSYVTASSTTFCLGDPSPGQFTITSAEESYTAVADIPGITVSLTAGGGPNTGSPCPCLGDVSYIMDLDIVLGVFKLPAYDDFAGSGKVYLASDNAPTPHNCQTADGRNTGYTQADLLGIKGLLPGDATAYMVYCERSQAEADTFDPCLEVGPWLGLTGVVYTTDDVSACDGACGNGGGCMAATAEAVE